VLKRKLLACAAVFVLIVGIGWSMDQQLERKRLEAFTNPMGSMSYSSFSAQFKANRMLSEQASVRYLPREYVRIIKRHSLTPTSNGYP
jgi:hypothetical protein